MRISVGAHDIQFALTGVSRRDRVIMYNMDSFIKLFPILLVCSAVAQYEGYEGYHSHGLEAYHQKHTVHEQEEHHGGYDLDFHAHPKYAFDYSVKDPHTGDDKEHWETRDGDKVKGSYTILENDGTKRVVEYEADDKNGFNAVVHKIGTPKHEEYKNEPPQYRLLTKVHEPAPYHEYHGKLSHEPAAYQHDFGHYEQGFVPVAGGYGH